MDVGLVISTAALIFSLVIAYWMHNQYHLDIRVEPAPPPKRDGPWISVIVPARNEEANIRACVQALINQTYLNYEVIVVDDRSTDSTPAILAELARAYPRLRIVQGRSLAEGWAGKPHALQQGAAAAQANAATGPAGEDSWLCFVDADTFASPDMLASTLAAAQATRADLFTMMTEQRLVTFWERVILPLVFTALSVGFSPRKVNDPSRPDAVANGQFLLFRRSAYQAIGGHAAVANSIVEDRDLARKIKAAGLRLVMADGRAVASTRMYTNFLQIWEGWTKNIYLGLADQPNLALLGVFGAFLALLAGLGFPAWIILGVISLANTGSPLVLLEALLAFAVILAFRVQAARALHVPAWYALTLPLGALVFAAMMFTSAFRVLSGKGVTWKGRKYMARE